MYLGEDVFLDDTVSAQLTAAIPKISDFFMASFPSFRKVEVACRGTATKTGLSRGKSAVFVSGGLDSTYSALKHRATLDYVITVTGFDCDQRGQPICQVRSPRVQALADELGLKVITASTNFKHFTDKIVPFGMAMGAVLAGVGLSLGGLLSALTVASNFTYRNQRPWGTHPLLDPWWSTECMQVFHDGCEASRIQKLQFIAHNEIAIRNMLVCSHVDDDRNCGLCPKCVRTRINMRVAGIQDRWGIFPHQLTTKELIDYRTSGPMDHHFLEENLYHLRHFGDDPELLAFLSIAYFHADESRPINWLRRRWKHLKLKHTTAPRT